MCVSYLPKPQQLPDEDNCRGGYLIGTDPLMQVCRVERLGECRGVGEIPNMTVS